MPGVDYQTERNLSGLFVIPDQNVPELSFAADFIISGHLQFFRNLQHLRHQPDGLFTLNQTGIAGHQPMGMRGVKTAPQLAIDALHGILSLIAVMMPFLHAQNGKYLLIRKNIFTDMPNPAQAGNHLVSFTGQLMGISHMHPLASAALAVYRTFRLHPFR